MERRLVRKVNIWVPVFDDGCFRFCGLDEDMRDKIKSLKDCKKKYCKPLSKFNMQNGKYVFRQ